MCGRIAIMDNGSLVALESKEKLLDRLEGRKLIISVENIPDTFSERVLNIETRVDIQENRLSLCLREGQSPGDILQSLLQNGLKVVDIEIEKPALEDVFLALTGKKPLTRNNNNNCL